MKFKKVKKLPLGEVRFGIIQEGKYGHSNTLYSYLPKKPNAPPVPGISLEQDINQSCNLKKTSEYPSIVICCFALLSLFLESSKNPTTVSLFQLHHFCQLPLSLKQKYASLHNASLKSQGAQCCIDRAHARMLHGRIKAYFLHTRSCLLWKRHPRLDMYLIKKVKPQERDLLVKKLNMGVVSLKQMQMTQMTHIFHPLLQPVTSFPGILLQPFREYVHLKNSDKHRMVPQPPSLRWPRMLLLMPEIWRENHLGWCWNPINNGTNHL